LLQLLLEKPRPSFSREELLEGISEKAETPKAVDVHIHNLKKKAPWLKRKSGP